MGGALLWGEPRFMRRGGNPPAPVFPRRGNGKGEIDSLRRRLFLLRHAEQVNAFRNTETNPKPNTLNCPERKIPPADANCIRLT